MAVMVLGGGHLLLILYSPVNCLPFSKLEIKDKSYLSPDTLTLNSGIITCISNLVWSVSRITFLRDAHSQKFGKPNNLKVFESM